MDIDEITVVGHSRGALVVDYNADNEVLISVSLDKQEFYRLSLQGVSG